MSSMLVFRKEKCIAELRAMSLPEQAIETSLPWMDVCDGKEVIPAGDVCGWVVGEPFEACIKWCEEVSVSE